ncbi:hypothetical protein U1Q18_007962 [Sarracenia purpurea var. burkii]
MSSRQTENTLIHSFEESFTSPVMENATGDTIEGAMDLPNEYAIDVNDVEDNSNDEGNNPNGGENNPNDNEDPHKHAYQRKPKNKTSKIWNEFNEVVRDGVKKAQCNYCKGDFSIPSSGATTQFHRHLNSCLARQASCKKQKTLSIDISGTECVANVGNFKYDRNKFKEVFPRYQDRDPSFLYVPTVDDWVKAEAVRNNVIFREVLYELYSEYVDIHNSAHAEHGGQENARETGSSSVSSSYAIGRSFTSGRSKFESFIRRVDTIQPIKSDLDVYLEESVFICDEGSGSHFDALE